MLLSISFASSYFNLLLSTKLKTTMTKRKGAPTSQSAKNSTGGKSPRLNVASAEVRKAEASGSLSVKKARRWRPGTGKFYYLLQ